MAKKKKAPDAAPVIAQLQVVCRSCGEHHALADFRIFKIEPLTYMDFCAECERKEGTLVLYRRFSAYATDSVTQAVFHAAAVPPEKRNADAVRLLIEPRRLAEPQTTEEAIRREIMRRELCGRRLVYYTTTMIPNYKPGWVHQDICRRLEAFVGRVERAESPRIMFMMPPRLGKSALCSDSLPSWILGKHPEWGVIGASYAQSLQVEFSRNIRDRLLDPEYQGIFPGTKLRADSRGVEEWKTTKGGGFIAAGVGVGINGKGMHVGIGDDLLKDHEAASSETIRTAANNWYQTVFRTRLAPGGGIILVGTRWHDSDVQGTQLSKEEELRKAGVPEEELEGWEVVSYPAIAEKNEYLLASGEIYRASAPPEDAAPAEIRLLRSEGEALHPERYPLRDMLKLKHTMAPQLWQALYQQNPTPDDGDFFTRSDIHYRYLPPDYYPLCKLFTTWDFAISKKTSANYTVGGVFALDQNDDLYLIDAVRDRWHTKELIKAIVDLVAKYNVPLFAGERGHIYDTLAPLLKDALKAHPKRLFISFDETLVPVTDKEVRARPLQGRMQMGKLFFSHQYNAKPGVFEDIERELLRFPNGASDDCVDMMSWGARMAMNVAPPARSSAPKRKSWQDQLPSVAGSSGAGNFMTG